MGVGNMAHIIQEAESLGLTVEEYLRLAHEDVRRQEAESVMAESDEKEVRDERVDARGD